MHILHFFLRKFFTNSSVAAVLIAAAGNYNGISPLIVFAPSIMKKGLSLSDLAASNYNSVSFAAQLLLKIVSGYFFSALHPKF